MKEPASNFRDAQDRRMNLADKIGAAPVRICEDARIGADSFVVKGVTIGARSVIGAGAVVSKDIPPDCIAGGIPARVIRKLESASDKKS